MRLTDLPIVRNGAVSFSLSHVTALWDQLMTIP
jgi:hypothetical protein